MLVPIIATHQSNTGPTALQHPPARRIAIVDPERARPPRSGNVCVRHSHGFPTPHCCNTPPTRRITIVDPKQVSRSRPDNGVFTFHTPGPWSLRGAPTTVDRKSSDLRADCDTNSVEIETLLLMGALLCVCKTAHVASRGDLVVVGAESSLGIVTGIRSY